MRVHNSGTHRNRKSLSVPQFMALIQRRLGEGVTHPWTLCPRGAIHSSRPGRDVLATPNASSSGPARDAGLDDEGSGHFVVICSRERRWNGRFTPKPRDDNWNNINIMNYWSFSSAVTGDILLKYFTFQGPLMSVNIHGYLWCI